MQSLITSGVLCKICSTKQETMYFYMHIMTMSHHAFPFLLLNPQTTYVVFTFIFMHKPPPLHNVLKIHAFVGLQHKFRYTYLTFYLSWHYLCLLCAPYTWIQWTSYGYNVKLGSIASIMTMLQAASVPARVKRFISSPKNPDQLWNPFSLLFSGHQGLFTQT